MTSQPNFGKGEADNVTEARAQKDEAILVLLAKLALVYWRPDFTPAQAKQLYGQYLDDLRPFSFRDINDAIEKYRQNPESKFYPTPGQLRGIIETVPSWDIITKPKHISERLKAGRAELEVMSENLLPSAAAPKQLAAE